jgi:hypothetical protein
VRRRRELPERRDPQESQEPVQGRQVVPLLAAWAAGQRLPEPLLALARLQLLALWVLPGPLLPLVPSHEARPPEALPLEQPRPASHGMAPSAACMLESRMAREPRASQSNPREQMARIPHRSNCRYRR